MIIYSSIGKTDCTGCKFYKKGDAIFAKRLPPPHWDPDIKFVSLALRVVQLPTVRVANMAMERIIDAIQQKATSVSFYDLEAESVHVDL